MSLDNELLERAAQASLNAGLAVDGEHGVASARHAARFVLAELSARRATADVTEAHIDAFMRGWDDSHPEMSGDMRKSVKAGLVALAALNPPMGR